MKAIKVFNLYASNPDTQRYYRWISTPLPEMVSDAKEDISNLTFEQAHGRVEELGYRNSNNRFKFILDISSDINATEEMFREIYDVAIKDFSDSFGMPEEHIRGRIESYMVMKLEEKIYGPI